MLGFFFSLHLRDLYTLYLVSLRNGGLTSFTGGGTGNVLVVMSSVENTDRSNCGNRCLINSTRTQI